MYSMQAHTNLLFFQAKGEQYSFAQKTARWIHETADKGFFYKIAVYALTFFAAVSVSISLIGIPLVLDVYRKLQQLNRGKDEAICYNLEDMIEKTQSLAQKGQKIGLWIGRPYDTPLPLDPHCKWVSMDSENVDLLPQKERIHFVLNEELKKQFEKMRNIFSLVVISPRKFLPFVEKFYPPIDALHQLLKPGRSSYLVYLPEAKYIPKNRFMHSQDGTSFVGPNDEYEENLNIVINKQKERLESLFHRVVYKTQTNFPFPMEEEIVEEPTDFFIALDPKPAADEF